MAAERAEQAAGAVAMLRGEPLARPLVARGGVLERGDDARVARAAAVAMSRRCVSTRVVARKSRQRSIAPGSSSWSQSTGVSDSVSGAPPSSRSSSGR